jgi:hypothetical protein
MNIELLIPVFFFAAVAVILPAVILAGLIVFAVREARAARRLPSSAPEVQGSKSKVQVSAPDFSHQRPTPVFLTANGHD